MRGISLEWQGNRSVFFISVPEQRECRTVCPLGPEQARGPSHPVTHSLFQQLFPEHLFSMLYFLRGVTFSSSLLSPLSLFGFGVIPSSTWRLFLYLYSGIALNGTQQYMWYQPSNEGIQYAKQVLDPLSHQLFTRKVIQKRSHSVFSSSPNLSLQVFMAIIHSLPHRFQTQFFLCSPATIMHRNDALNSEVDLAPPPPSPSRHVQVLVPLPFPKLRSACYSLHHNKHPQHLS